MRISVRVRGVALAGFFSLATIAGGGCQGEPNEEGIRDAESIVPPDAPTTQEEMYQQQMGGGGQPGP